MEKKREGSIIKLEKNMVDCKKHYKIIVGLSCKMFWNEWNTIECSQWKLGHFVTVKCWISMTSSCSHQHCFYGLQANTACFKDANHQRNSA